MGKIFPWSPVFFVCDLSGNYRERLGRGAIMLVYYPATIYSVKHY